MFSYLDPVLFPDECKILQVSADRYVYPIFKNGSSSLTKAGYPAISPLQIQQLDVVDVFLRNPLQRYVSGVQTYLKRLPGNCDRETVLYMIDEYLFLNRHFCLQFHWLVNLARHTSANMHMLSIDRINKLTDINWNAQGLDEELLERFSKNQKLQFYLGLDQIIIDRFMNKTVSLKQIVDHIKQQHTELYQEVLARSQQLCTVLD